MAKATIDAFKAAFQKPKRPKEVKSKDKKAIEKEFEKRKAAEFREKAKKLYQDDPVYFKKLLGYKIAKHWDDPARGYWLSETPPDALEEIVGGLIGAKPDKAMVKKTIVELCDCGAAMSKLHKTDPELFFSTIMESYAELDERQRTALGKNLPESVNKRIMLQVFDDENAAMTKAFMLTATALSDDELKQLATAKPKFFIENVMVPLKGSNIRGADMLGDPKMRDILSQGGQAWTDLVAATPLLKLIDGLEKKFKTKKTTKDKVDTVFAAIVNNEGIELTYFTNKLDDDRAILTGMTDQDGANRDAMGKELDAEFPDVPATQCHNLVSVMTRAVKAVLGDDVTITTDHVKGMALTKKLSTLPGGLLPNTFSGNVLDEDGNLTGQVLFTGDEFGKQSHTWPIIDGEAYDPVLGTRGDAVKGAVENEFTWIVPNMSAKGAGGWYFVPVPDQKCAPNGHGFGSMYRLTKDPTPFERGVFGLKFRASADGRPQVLSIDGPANGLLQIGDVLLEIDGKSTKGADVSKDGIKEFNFADIGQTTTFKVQRRNEKKPLKVNVTAVAPSTIVSVET